jgi:hypothetical protein
MTCPRCQQENPAEAHFCMKCGTGLTLVCAKVQHRAADGRSLLFRMRATGDRCAGGQRFTSPDASTLPSARSCTASTEGRTTQWTSFSGFKPT